MRNANGITRQKPKRKASSQKSSHDTRVAAGPAQRASHAASEYFNIKCTLPYMYSCIQCKTHRDRSEHGRVFKTKYSIKRTSTWLYPSIPRSTYSNVTKKTPRDPPPRRAHGGAPRAPDPCRAGRGGHPSAVHMARALRHRTARIALPAPTPPPPPYHPHLHCTAQFSSASQHAAHTALHIACCTLHAARGCALNGVLLASHIALQATRRVPAKQHKTT